jgi:hypothetical protein
MNSHDFNEAVDPWITALNHYRFDQLCTRPAVGSWCLGQVYLHLINDTQFYIEQIISCLSTNEHAAEQPSAFGRTLLANNDFPDQLLPGAPENDLLPLPSGKEELLTGLLRIKNEMNSLAVQMANSPSREEHCTRGCTILGLATGSSLRVCISVITSGKKTASTNFLKRSSRQNNEPSPWFVAMVRVARTIFIPVARTVHQSITSFRNSGWPPRSCSLI